MNIDTAMVMAAGLGTRMRPLTDDRPKPLVSVGGRTLIDHMLDRLVAAGVKRAVVNVHYRADQMEAHLAGRRDLEIIVSDERERLLETGGALVKAAPLLGNKPVFVVNTDAIWSEGGSSACEALKAGWRDLEMDALLLLADMRETLGFDGPGDFFLGADGRIGRRGTAPSAPWAFAGVQILHPRVLEGLTAEPFSTNRIWDEALRRARLFGAPLDGFWMHIGDPRAREEAEARLGRAR